MPKKSTKKEAQFKCPMCKRGLTFVTVVSTCWQDGYLEGNKIRYYGDIEGIGSETIKIECPWCSEVLTSMIKEELK